MVHRPAQSTSVASCRRGGRDFEVPSQGGTVRGSEWGSGPVVYLMHGWGGRGSQLAAFVDPLVRTGYRVVLFDALSHGRSTAGPSGAGRSNAVELGRALDDVAARFGPAESVVAHSLGGLATLLASKHGWLGYDRLALLAPSLGVDDVLDVFTDSLGIGPRTRAALENRIAARVGLPLTEFQADALLTEPVPTLIVHDRTDRQTPYAGSATLADGNPDVHLARHQWPRPPPVAARPRGGRSRGRPHQRCGPGGSGAGVLSAATGGRPYPAAPG